MNCRQSHCSCQQTALLLVMPGHLRWATAASVAHPLQHIKQRCVPIAMQTARAIKEVMPCEVHNILVVFAAGEVVQALLTLCCYLQGIYFGCTNGTIVCVDPESLAVLCTAVATETGPAAAACVSSVAVNKDAVVVSSNDCPQLCFYSRCSASSMSGKQQQQQQQTGRGLQLLGSVRAGSQGETRVLQAWHASDVMQRACSVPAASL
jgi:hypothetical protein